MQVNDIVSLKFGCERILPLDLAMLKRRDDVVRVLVEYGAFEGGALSNGSLLQVGWREGFDVLVWDIMQVGMLF